MIKLFTVLSLLCFLYPQIVLSESVTFTFNPPDGYKVISYGKSNRVYYIDGKKNKIQSNKINTETIFTKNLNGFKIIRKVILAESFENGKRLESPAGKVLIGNVMTYITDNKGNLLSIEGLDSLLNNLKKTIHPDKQHLAVKVFNTEVRKKKEFDDWQNNITKFVGKSVKDGTVGYTISSLNLYGDILKYLKQMNFVDVKKDSVKINYKYTTKKPTIHNWLKEINPVVVEKLNLDQIDYSSYGINGSRYEIINPKTMISKEKHSKIILEYVTTYDDGSQHEIKRIQTKNTRYEIAN